MEDGTKWVTNRIKFIILQPATDIIRKARSYQHDEIIMFYGE